MKKISIITVNFNNWKGLEDTIKSIISLDRINLDIEYLVIDGMSTDNSVTIINQYSDKIDYWISEADSGIYNAMNKGIEKANGEYLLFMNSGDIIQNPKVFQECLNHLSNKEDIIYCDISVKEIDNRIWVKKLPSKLNLEFFYNNSLPHQATFIKRELFKKYGLYDEKLKICSDWTFTCKCILLKKATYLYFNANFCLFSADGISSDPKNGLLVHKEKKDYILKNFIPFGKFYCRYFDLKNDIYRIKEKFKNKFNR